jgi:hypothetical protein
MRRATAVSVASGPCSTLRRPPPARPPKARRCSCGAAAYGKVENVGLLLARGAQLQARDARGLTALDIATEQKQDEVSKLLAQAGAPR